MELTKGLKFRSRWFEGITEILDIDRDNNTLDVEIYRASGHNHSEEWNLQHTIWGFEAGDYIICCDNCTDSKGQNIGNMYRCDTCGRLVS